MKIAFLKGTGFVDRLIQLWTWGKYCHAELVFSDGVWFSTELSSPFKTSFHRYTELSQYWDFVELNITPEQEQEIRKFCTGELGCSYDWKGIFLSMILPLGRADPDKWFCSEVCAASLQTIGILPNIVAHRISPNKLYKLLKK